MGRFKENPSIRYVIISAVTIIVIFGFIYIYSRFGWFAVGILVIGALWLAGKYAKDVELERQPQRPFESDFEKLIRLHSEYNAALDSGDKISALRLGRQYYAIQRSDGELTLQDEQSIANDLSTMN